MYCLLSLVAHLHFSACVYSCISMLPSILVLLESYLRRVVKPLEALLVSHKRIVLKDSAVSVPWAC